MNMRRGVARHTRTEKEFAVYRALPTANYGLARQPCFLATVFINDRSCPRFQFLILPYESVRTIPLPTFWLKYFQQGSDTDRVRVSHADNTCRQWCYRNLSF